jgi:hypothetical protein
MRMRMAGRHFVKILMKACTTSGTKAGRPAFFSSIRNY